MRLTADEEIMLQHAESEARRLGRPYVSTEHLLLGLLGQVDGGAHRVLQGCGVSLPAYRRAVQAIAWDGRPPHDAEIMYYSPRVEKAFTDARREALAMGHDAIRTEHLLLGVIQDDHIAGMAMVRLGVGLDEVRQAALNALRAAS